LDDEIPTPDNYKLKNSSSASEVTHMTLPAGAFHSATWYLLTEPAVIDETTQFHISYVSQMEKTGWGRDLIIVTFVLACVAFLGVTTCACLCIMKRVQRKWHRIEYDTIDAINN
jgi:hypothetical protein